MANNKKVMDSIKDFLLKMKALDESIPEELAEDALKMTQDVKAALCDEDPEPLEVTTDEEPEEETKDENIEAKVEDAMVKVMHKYGLIKDESMASLDAIDEGCETEDENNEEEVTVDPEKMNDDARRVLLKKVKPMVASIKDAATRKKFADAFAEALNLSTGDQYGSVVKMARANAKDSLQKQQSMHQPAEVPSDFGMQIAEKWNPHYKKEG